MVGGPIERYGDQRRTRSRLRDLNSIHQKLKADRRPGVTHARAATSSTSTRGCRGLRSIVAQVKSQIPLNESAERAGFEPAVPLRVHMISNHAPSATRSPL